MGMIITVLMKAIQTDMLVDEKQRMKVVRKMLKNVNTAGIIA